MSPDLEDEEGSPVLGCPHDHGHVPLLPRCYPRVEAHCQVAAHLCIQPLHFHSFRSLPLLLPLLPRSPIRSVVPAVRLGTRLIHAAALHNRERRCFLSSFLVGASWGVASAMATGGNLGSVVVAPWRWTAGRRG
ncbi:hypothetical protein BRADI_4g25151v3 [Brachypodium distachyon]|uniref:Uncharacterized protein n=1 Tax=Brachypodium distachyon TaxID=15368 RepID=A0A2K2CQ79_BRADI|nr:hypothetical protein BRADI_4g25151v3 [Brachypodium distachyon]